MSRELSWSHGDLNFKTYRGYHGKNIMFWFWECKLHSFDQIVFGFIVILQFDIVISRFHLSALLWKPMHGLKISSANITAWEKNRISRRECWVGDSSVDEVASCLNGFLKLLQVGKKHKQFLNGCQKMMIQHVEKTMTVAWFSRWANHGNSGLVSFGT